jgi:hypothetical protein
MLGKILHLSTTLLLALTLLAPVVTAHAGSQVSRFETVGTINKVDLGASSITINGIDFKLTAETVIHTMTRIPETSIQKLDRLVPDTSIGYKSKPAGPGKPPVITEILIFRGR